MPRPQTFRRIRSIVTIAALASAVQTQAADEPAKLPEYLVPGQRVGSLDIEIPADDLRRPSTNPGIVLLDVPGVFGQTRSADSPEPNIRGLSFDRIATSLNGIPLVNASPERTHSPVVLVGAIDGVAVRVIKSLPSVTLGPVTTGGRVELNTDPFGAAAPAGAQGYSGQVTTTYDGGREGYSVNGQVRAQLGAWDAGASFFRNDLDDYTAGDGRKVAAGYRDLGGSASLGWRDATHRIRAEVLQKRYTLQETLSLPLDGKNTDATEFTLNDRWIRDTGPLASLEWRAGYGVTDPYITSEARPIAALSFAQAMSRSFGAGVNATFRLSDADRLSVGGDFARQYREAIRTTPAGRDYIWPGATYRDTGVFAEWTRRLAAGWRLRLGARGDEVESSARFVDQPALGRPLRDQFVTFNGPAAAKTDLKDHVGATNLLLEWTGKSATSAFLGAGISAQPAPITERYRAFLNGLGGDGRGGPALELGNPSLRSERKEALEAGGAWRPAAVDFEATVYAYRVRDFILRTPVGATQPPLAPMVVFGYRNVDATFVGAELGATLKPAAAWRIPLTFAVAQGRNDDAGRKLSEIPPWEAGAAVRFQGNAGRVPLTVDAGVRVVGAKDNPAPLDNPLFVKTGGFSVWHLRAGVPLGARVRLDAGLENLFDRRYSEYLTPPVGPNRPASGDLLPGQRVPAPGRSGWASVTLSW